MDLEQFSVDLQSEAVKWEAKQAIAVLYLLI